MQNELAVKISQDLNYQNLVRSRTRYGWVLTFVMLIIYFGFIFLVAFKKELLATPIGNGVTTLSIPVGIGVIIVTILLTGIYVRRANSEFDTLTQKIKKDHE